MFFYYLKFKLVRCERCKGSYFRSMYAKDDPWFVEIMPLWNFEFFCPCPVRARVLKIFILAPISVTDCKPWFIEIMPLRSFEFFCPYLDGLDDSNQLYLFIQVLKYVHYKELINYLRTILLIKRNSLKKVYQIIWIIYVTRFQHQQLWILSNSILINFREFEVLSSIFPVSAEAESCIRNHQMPDWNNRKYIISNRSILIKSISLKILRLSFIAKNRMQYKCKPYQKGFEVN